MQSPWASYFSPQSPPSPGKPLAPAGGFSFAPELTDTEIYERLCEFITSHKRALFERIALERTRHVTCVLEDIYQPHNASAVVRTCDLLGIQDLHIIENRNKYTVNPDVTLGSSKWVDMHRWRGESDNTARSASRT